MDEVKSHKANTGVRNVLLRQTLTLVTKTDDGQTIVPLQCTIFPYPHSFGDTGGEKPTANYSPTMESEQLRHF